MRAILGSWGLSNEPVIKACEGLIGKSRNDVNIAIINEAIKGESGDHRWFAEELQYLSGIIGGNMEFIDIQSHPLNIASTLSILDQSIPPFIGVG